MSEHTEQAAVDDVAEDLVPVVAASLDDSASEQDETPEEPADDEGDVVELPFVVDTTIRPLDDGLRALILEAHPDLDLDHAHPAQDGPAPGEDWFAQPAPFDPAGPGGDEPPKAARPRSGRTRRTSTE